MVYANQRGEVFEHPGLLMAGRAGHIIRAPEPEELIPMPEGTELFLLPERLPIGVDPENGTPLVYDEPGVVAVAAFVSPAHTTTLLSAYKSNPGAPMLPLFAYTAVGWWRGRFWVAAFRSDPDRRQDPDLFDHAKILQRTERALRDHRDNRLIQHLGRCCLRYGCPAARNYFLQRWEAPLPTSPTCNAACIGCISLQTSDSCTPPQERITFVPTEEEICEVAVPHLKKAPRAIVSFGQGCEGEPLLQSPVIERAIKRIREATTRGTINMNTNGSRPVGLERLLKAGLDSVRISLNSPIPERYNIYYRPKGYSFEEVKTSIAITKKHSKFVSLNYFVFPGVTDDPSESEAFFGLLEDLHPDMIQLRNLNIDPEFYIDVMAPTGLSRPIGIIKWLRLLKKRFPEVRLGYFNPPLR